MLRSIARATLARRLPLHRSFSASAVSLDSLRDRCWERIVNAKPKDSGHSGKSLEDTFAKDVFHESAMQKYLSPSEFTDLQEHMATGTSLTPVLADAVANAMVQWARSHGVTHYAHWFQPNTGLTAEKHDSFLQIAEGGTPLMAFSGSKLIKGEPDGSSFPSGGLRTTFEARGYTVWDPSSPAFIQPGINGSVLCIPTAFCSWSGHALDQKTPLLRSVDAISKESTELLHLLGDESVRYVKPGVGIEQEFFLVDRGYYMARPDLVHCGRTLLGASSAKDQDQAKHYFGSVPQRIAACLQDAEWRLWKLGVPVMTRHNEVAPGQYELAPHFEQANVATDHNMLQMEIMRIVARDHGLACLFHEKPFAGVNGSGKHNNWSLATDQGLNLLAPGECPQENLRFLLFLAATVRAIHKRGDLLRFSVATYANDFRLGGHEAPPAIMSVFLGELDPVIRSIMNGEALSSSEARALATGVGALPALTTDNSDRNRTSPFAYTGNRFEFRAVGSAQSPALPNVIINTIVAEAVRDIRLELEAEFKKGGSRTEAISHVLKSNFKDHYNVVFNGDNYSDDWRQEAEKRGLPNLVDTVSAIDAFVTEENVKLFDEFGVYSPVEVEARGQILYAGYAQDALTEAGTCLDMAKTQVVPASLEHQKRFAESVCSMEALRETPDDSVQKTELFSYNETLTKAMTHANGLASTLGDAPESVRDQAIFCRDNVLPAMNNLRGVCDKLELSTNDKLWPLPKYNEIANNSD